MKITVTQSEFIDAFRRMGRMDSFSYAGLCALFDYLEESGSDDMELDVIALCCEFEEHGTALEPATEYGFEPDPEADEETNEESALRYLRDKTSVIEFTGGIIIQSF